ncbi:galactofuranosyltransferase, partial [Streptococcus pneumoniae]|nr:galactofuranosyltransferase [Streptococcus pneumoniae]
MKYFVEETLLDEQDKKNAGGKARQDVTDILESIGYQKLIAESEMNERQELNAVQRLVHHYKVKKMWKKTLSVVGKGDEVIIQFPLLNHSLFFNQVIKQLSKNGVKVYFLIHDLESLRWSQSKSISLKSRIRLNIEEHSVLRLSEGIIAHNKKMKSYIKTPS